MKKCNKCNKKKPDALFRMYRGKKVKTCKQCEFSWKRTILRFLAYRRKLTAWEKFASRVGYMGAGFLIAAAFTDISSILSVTNSLHLSLYLPLPSVISLNKSCT